MQSVLVGKQAPRFTTKAVIHGSIEPLSLDAYKGRYVLLFFYPLDFTFVCPTELHAFQELLHEFENRGASILGCSIDSPFAHLAWLNTPRRVGGIEGITYPILSDLDKSISKEFGVLQEEEGVALRGQFLIDKEGVIRHQLINDLSIGRNAHEALRLLDALIHHEQYGHVCPANWQQGEKSMEPTQEGLVQFFR